MMPVSLKLLLIWIELSLYLALFIGPMLRRRLADGQVGQDREPYRMPRLGTRPIQSPVRPALSELVHPQDLGAPTP